jgi:hypothetical protein
MYSLDQLLLEQMDDNTESDDIDDTEDEDVDQPDDTAVAPPPTTTNLKRYILLSNLQILKSRLLDSLIDIEESKRENISTLISFISLLILFFEHFTTDDLTLFINNIYQYFNQIYNVAGAADYELSK